MNRLGKRSAWRAFGSCSLLKATLTSASWKACSQFPTPFEHSRRQQWNESFPFLFKQIRANRVALSIRREDYVLLRMRQQPGPRQNPTPRDLVATECGHNPKRIWYLRTKFAGQFDPFALLELARANNTLVRHIYRR
jgi:hypothetical protein